MKKRILILGISIFMLVLPGAFQGAFAASLDLTLDTTGTHSHLNFDSGPAYTYAWHGDIIFLQNKIGVFNAVFTSQDSGTDYCLTHYDFVIPSEFITGAGTIPEFASILVSNRPDAASLVENPNALTPIDPFPRPIPQPTVTDKGTVYAASPKLAGLVGITAEIVQPVALDSPPFFRLTF